jgi:hypothetical protein
MSCKDVIKRCELNDSAFICEMDEILENFRVNIVLGTSKIEGMTASNCSKIFSGRV